LRTTPIDVHNTVLIRTQIPPTWAIDDAIGINVVGSVDVVAHADGEAIAVAFADVEGTQTWDLSFRVDLL
jgi:hypothetical protein